MTFSDERRRRGERRRVLEDVEVAVEVRDERPLVRDVVVDDADALVVAVVLLRDVEVQLGERLAGDRLALLAPSRACAARTRRTASAGTPCP